MKYNFIFLAFLGTNRIEKLSARYSNWGWFGRFSNILTTFLQTLTTIGASRTRCWDDASPRKCNPSTAENKKFKLFRRHTYWSRILFSAILRRGAPIYSHIYGSHIWMAWGMRMPIDQVFLFIIWQVGNLRIHEWMDCKVRILFAGKEIRIMSAQNEPYRRVVGSLVSALS